MKPHFEKLCIYRIHLIFAMAQKSCYIFQNVQRSILELAIQITGIFPDLKQYQSVFRINCN